MPPVDPLAIGVIAIVALLTEHYLVDLLTDDEPEPPRRKRMIGPGPKPR